MGLRQTIRSLALIALLATGTFAQQPVEPPAVETDDAPATLAGFEESDDATNKEPDATEKREDVSEKLRVAEKVLNSAKKASPAGQSAPEPLANEVKRLKQLEAIHAQQQAANERTVELQTAKAELEGKLNTLRTRGTVQERPYNFTLLEQLRDELALETDRSESLARAVEQHQQSLERAQAQHDEKETARRRAKEAVETNKDKAKVPKLATDLELADLESKLAGETAKLRKVQRGNEQIILETQELQKEFLTETIAAIDSEVAITDKDREEQLDAVKMEEVELEWQRDEAQTQYSILEQRWTDARERLENASEKNTGLEAEVEAHLLARQTQQQTLEIVNQRLGRVADNRTAWQRRFQLEQQSFVSKDVTSWHDEAKQIADQLERELATQTTRLADWRRETAVLEKKYGDLPTTDNMVATWRSEQLSHRQRLTEVYEKNQESIEASRRLQAKLLAEISAAGGGRLGVDLSYVWNRMSKLWNYELVAVDDRPITPRKICTGLLLLVFGIVVARWLTRWIGGRVSSRARIHPNAVAAMQSLSFYVSILLVSLFSLHVANVPLGAFTMLGGALALGVGFGSQNIINNFISGLIILAERPVRVGDLIEIDNFFATVDRIGARSTRMRTGANLEIIVPNSHFLEHSVVNWTLSDTTVRSKVCVGVAYGSPTDLVQRILIEVALGHQLVLESPAPLVLFTDFADNTLNFEIRFWIRARQLSERLQIESDLRYEIDCRFRESGISIAFPQRDVHIDTTGPIPVQMVEASPVPQAKAA